MLIFKFIISILIIGITGYIGVYKSNKLKSREYILRDAVTFFKLVENEIQYMLNILPNAYEISRQKLTTSLKHAIGQIVVDMLDSDNMAYIEQSIVTNISLIDGLTDYDRNVIISTFKNLGRSNIEGQINIIENSMNILDNQISEANEIKLTNSKLYKTMGVIAGLMIVIIFI